MLTFKIKISRFLSIIQTTRSFLIIECLWHAFSRVLLLSSIPLSVNLKLLRLFFITSLCSFWVATFSAALHSSRLLLSLWLEICASSALMAASSASLFWVAVRRISVSFACCWRRSRVEEVVWIAFWRRPTRLFRSFFTSAYWLETSDKTA